MSTKIENVVYRASWRDEISATLNSVSFSTATRRLHSRPRQLGIRQWTQIDPSSHKTQPAGARIAQMITQQRRTNGTHRIHSAVPGSAHWQRLRKRHRRYLEISNVSQRRHHGGSRRPNVHWQVSRYDNRRLQHPCTTD